MRFGEALGIDIKNIPGGGTSNLPEGVANELHDYLKTDNGGEK